MRIGIVTHVYPPAGRRPGIPGIFIPPFARALIDRGHQVWVVAPGQEDSLAWEDGLLVRRFGAQVPAGGLGGLQATRPADWLLLGRFLRRGSRALHRMLAQEGADLLLAYWAFPAGLLCAWATLCRPIPYVVWALGSDIYLAARLPGLRQMVSWALRRAAVRYANGPALCRAVEQLADRGCQFLPAARPLPEPEPVALAPDRVHLLFAGRLEPVKGPDILLEAAKKLAERELDFHLWMIGEGSLRASLAQTIQQSGLADRVTLLGFVSDSRLAGYLAAADLLVVPSRSESMPLVVGEAARFGTPVVVSDVGDLGPLVRERRAGLVVPPEQPERLARAVVRALEERGRSAFSAGLRGLAGLYGLESAVTRFLTDAARLGLGSAAACRRPVWEGDHGE